MIEIKDIEELTDKVREKVENNTFYLIAIDGVYGSGKSTIARNLSSSLDIKHIELDNERYLQKQKGGYVDYINYSVLLEDLQECKEQNKSVIVEGICILEILERADINPVLHIYLKKLAVSIWLDGKHFDYSSTVEEEVKKDREQLEKFHKLSAQIEVEKEEFNYSEQGIFHEQLQYHFKFKPDKNADIHYTWVQ